MPSLVGSEMCIRDSMWTAGWVEPGDKWMMVNILGWWPCGHHSKMVTIIHLSAAPNPLVGNRQGGTFSRAHLMIQKLQKWCSFWIQKLQKYCISWIQKLWIWTKKILNPEIVEIMRFLDPETAEILQFLDPEIVKMDKKNSGSRNRRNGAISGSRNRRKGQQILYAISWEMSEQ